MFATLSEGHFDLADILYLVAFILFTLDVVLEVAHEKLTWTARSVLIPAGLALVALAFFVQ